MPRRSSSSCRAFRRLHVEYVDGLLSDEALSSCRAHLDECPACAAHDVRIRRSLLALQALPDIHVSDGFHERLCERLSQESLHYTPAKPAWMRRMMAGAIIAAAAVLYFAATHSHMTAPLQPTQELVRAPEASAPVTAPTADLKTAATSTTAATTAPATAAAMVATTSTAITQATTTATRSARFEALPGQSRLPLITRAPHIQSVRLQSVNYIGQ